MKKTYVLLAVVCMAALSACSNPLSSESGGEGSITISIGMAGRIAVTPGELDNITHYLTLTGPGRPITNPLVYYIPGPGIANIEVAAGTWNISIRAVGDTPALYNAGIDAGYQFDSRMLRALGFSAPIAVRNGESASAIIGMISAVEVANEAQLRSAISLARDDGREKIVLLQEDTDVNEPIIVPAGRNITLATSVSTGVTISRGASLGSGAYIFVETGTGTLRRGSSRPGMTGNVSVEGLPNVPPPPPPLVPTVSVTIGSNPQVLFYNLEEALLYEMTSQRTITLLADQELDHWPVALGQNITLVGYGQPRVITRPGDAGGTMVTVNGVLSLGNNITLRGGSGNAPLVVLEAGQLNMNTGSLITNNNNTAPAGSNGGGAVLVSGGAFQMTGGEISGNTSSNGGGGVFVDGGTFTMSGNAVIRNNTASGSGGGGVFVASGGFTMTGNALIGGVAASDANTATNGGGVFVAGGTFGMTIPSTIRSNTASNSGGGVYVGGGTFNMTSGVISSNNSGTTGGGVLVRNATFTTGYPVEISANRAGTFGGGVEVGVNGIFTMQNGTISGNTVGSMVGMTPIAGIGGGVSVNADGRFDMLGGNIGGNLAYNRGGGVSVVTNGIFRMYSGTIYDSTSNTTGTGAADTGPALFNEGTAERRYLPHGVGAVAGALSTSSGAITWNGLP